MRVLSLRLVMLVVAYLPSALRRRAIRRLARLRYNRYQAGMRPQAANIRLRLGVSEQEAEHILQRWFELELLAIVDGVRSRSLDARKVRAVIEIRGIEHLDDALSRGRGAVLTTGHGTGLTLFFAALGALGYRPSLIRLKAHDRKGRLARWLYERYNRRLERHGCTNLWMEPSGFRVGVLALNALRRNELVISPVDVSQSGDDAEVTFLGGPALMPRGMAVLAKAANAPLLSFFVYRDTDGRQIAEIDAPVEVTEVDAAVQHSAKALERQILVHPADWSPWHVFDRWRNTSAERGPHDHPGRRPRDRSPDAPIAGA